MTHTRYCLTKMLPHLGAGKPLPLVGSSWYLRRVPSEFMSPWYFDCRAHLCVCHCQADPSILSMSIILVTVQPWLPGAPPPPHNASLLLPLQLLSAWCLSTCTSSLCGFGQNFFLMPFPSVSLAKKGHQCFHVLAVRTRGYNECLAILLGLRWKHLLAPKWHGQSYDFLWQTDSRNSLWIIVITCVYREF